MLATLTALVAFSAASAQSFKTGYFLENYTYGYRINAAAPLEEDGYTFFALGLGNLSAEVNSNFAITSLLAFDKNGSLVLPVFSDVLSGARTVSNLLRDNQAELDLNANLFTVGWQGNTNRFSLEYNLRSNAYLDMPLDFFSLLSRGLNSLSTGEYEPDYSFVGMHFGMSAYSELALGYTQQIGNVVTLGVRLKGLFGNHSAGLDWALSIGPGINKDIRADTEGSVFLSAPVDLSIPTMRTGGQEYYYLGSMGEAVATWLSDWNNLPKKRIAGLGFAADLGVTVKPFDGFELSASVNDLGFINWKSTVNGRMHFKDELDGNDYKQIFAIDNSGSARYTTSLNYTIHAGAKYHMPFYDRLSLGLLGTFRQYSGEGRFGIDVTPLDFISIAGSFGIGTYGGSVGAAVNFRIPLVNFFVGMDGMFFDLIPGTPIPSGRVCTVVNAGLLLAI